LLGGREEEERERETHSVELTLPLRLPSSFPFVFRFSKPLSLTLLPSSPTTDSPLPPTKTKTKAVISFLIRLPSRSSLDRVQPTSSTASCETDEEEDKLEIVIGSDLVLVESGEGGLWELELELGGLGKKEGEGEG